jgi:polar amino acid transport system substrate-binding protein
MSFKSIVCLFITVFTFLSTPTYSLTFYAEDLPPYHFKNAHGKTTGALVEIVQEALKAAQLHGQFQIVPMARAYKELQTVPDALMISLLKTPSRETQFHWLAQTYFADAYLVGLKEAVHTVDSLQGAQTYRVSTIRGYSSEKYLLQAGFSEDDTLVLVSHYQQLWQLLFKKRTDLVMTNTLTLNYEVLNSGLDPTLLKKKLHLDDFPSELWLVANLNLPADIAKALSAGMSTIKRQGTYTKILERWQLPLPQSDK